MPTEDQPEPFHRIAVVRPPAAPTAMQNEVLRQLTPESPPAAGTGTTDQVAPFHCSTRVAAWVPPTAMQNEVVVHETALR